MGQQRSLTYIGLIMMVLGICIAVGAVINSESNQKSAIWVETAIPDVETTYELYIDEKLVKEGTYEPEGEYFIYIYMYDWGLFEWGGKEITVKLVSTNVNGTETSSQDLTINKHYYRLYEVNF